MPEYDIVLLRFESNLNRHELPIPGLQRLFGLDLETAQKVAQSLPCVVKSRAPLDVAGQYVAALRSIGAQVELRPCASVSAGEPAAGGVARDARATLPQGTLDVAHRDHAQATRQDSNMATVLASAQPTPSVVDLPEPTLPPVPEPANLPSAIRAFSRDEPLPGATIPLTEEKWLKAGAWSELAPAPSPQAPVPGPATRDRALSDARSFMELVPIAAGQSVLVDSKDRAKRDDPKPDAKNDAIPLAPYLSARDRRVITPLASNGAGNPIGQSPERFSPEVIHSRRPPPARLFPAPGPVNDDESFFLQAARKEQPRDLADLFALFDRFRKSGLGDLLAGVSILAAGLFIGTSTLVSGKTPRFDYLLDLLGAGWIAVGIYKLRTRWKQ